MRAFVKDTGWTLDWLYWMGWGNGLVFLGRIGRMDVHTPVGLDSSKCLIVANKLAKIKRSSKQALSAELDVRSSLAVRASPMRAVRWRPTARCDDVIQANRMGSWIKRGGREASFPGNRSGKIDNGREPRSWVAESSTTEKPGRLLAATREGQQRKKI